MTRGGPRGAGGSAWRLVLRSFALLAGGESVARLLGLAAVIVMARRLGPGDFGVVILGTTLATWFRLVVDSGTEVLGIRDASRTPHRFRELTEPLLGLRIALSLGAAVIFGGAATMIARTGTAREVLPLFALILPMMGLNLRFMALAVKAAWAVALGNVAAQALLGAGVVLLVQNRHDLHLVPLLMASAEFVYAVVVLAALARSCGIIRPRIDLVIWRRTLRAGLPLAVSGMAGAATNLLGLFLIAVMLRPGDVGLYGAAYKPVLFFSTLVALLSIAFLSGFSGSAGDAERTELVSRTVTVSVLVTVPAAALLSAGSGEIMRLLYGQSYGGSAMPMAILAWSLPLLALALTYGSILTWGNRQALAMRHNITGTVASVAGNVVAIPLFRLAGVAAVIVGSLALVMVLNYRSAVRLGLTASLWAPPLRPSS